MPLSDTVLQVITNIYSNLLFMLYFTSSLSLSLSQYIYIYDKFPLCFCQTQWMMLLYVVWRLGTMLSILSRTIKVNNPNTIFFFVIPFFSPVLFISLFFSPSADSSSYVYVYTFEEILTKYCCILSNHLTKKQYIII